MGLWLIKSFLLEGLNMAKNFSVAWLSQSSHGPNATQQESSSGLDALHSRIQCAVVSRSLEKCEDFSLLTKTSTVSNLRLEGVGNMKSVKAPSSPTNSCGYTSGSESEVCEDSEGESGPNRRVRTKFTSYQISRLEKTFNKHKYLGVTQRRKIAEKLRLSETQVKTWFQNRRMKLKREVQETHTEYLGPALLGAAVFPPAAFQHHAFGGQRPAFTPSAFPLHPQHLHPQVSLQHMARPHMIHPALLASCYY